VNFVSQVTPRIAISADAVHGAESGNGFSTSWNAVEALAKFNLLDGFWVAPRFEIYRDDHGVTLGTAQTIYAQTLTATYEFRHDGSTEPVFVSRTGAPTPDQSTLSLSLLIKF
jgi:hypothetical protein